MAINFLVGAAIVIAMVDVPLFVNLVVETDLERAAVVSGAVLASMTAAMAVTSYLGGVATERTWYRPVIVAGLSAAIAGYLLMGVTWGVDTSLGTMAWQLAILGFGFGLVTAPTSAAMVDVAPDDRRGTTGGLVILSRLMGLAVGLSGLTAWALYRFNELRDSVELPALSDPGYEDALVAATAEVTASSLTETFLFAVGVLVVALGLAFLVRRLRVPAAEGLARGQSDSA
jgi:MFS family permease